MVALNEERGHHYGSITETNGDVANGTERKPLVIDNNGETTSHTTTTVLPPNPLLFLKEKELLHDEIAGMTKLAIPVIMTYLLEMLPGIVTIILVGRVDEEDAHAHGGGGGDDGEEEMTMSMQKLHLDAAALAVMFTNVVALSPAYGILTALDTLCSQAHGASQPSKMGTYSLTGIAVICCVLLSSTILIWNASSILISLGQPIEVSIMAGHFIRYMLPGVPFLYIYELIRKVFQSRNKAMPMLISTVVCNVVNVALGYYLVHYTGWGWMGAAVARSAGNIALVPTVLMGVVMGMGGADESDGHTTLPNNGHGWDTQQYLEVDNDSRTKRYGDDEDEKNDDDSKFLHHIWKGFVISEALSAKAIIEFLSIGIPGMLQVMFEWCAFEAIALLCGILPHQEAIIGIGANTIIMTTSSMTYMLYLGASVSGSVRVGNALGAGDAHRAEIASNLTLLTGAIMAMINVVLLLTFRNALPWFFTTDLDIIEEAQHLFLVAAAFQLPDAVNGSVQGIFRGSGRMAVGASWNFFAYYIIGIPLGYVLGVKHGFGVEGLWWGMTAGLCVISIGCTMIVLRSNWNKLALDATARLNRQ